MMSKHHYQKCLDGLLVMLLAIHFLFAHSGLPGYVLCIGSDGHVTIESSRDQGNCDDRDTHPVSAQSVNLYPAAKAVSGHCGPCVDVALQADCDEDVPIPPKKSPIPALLPLPICSYSYLAGLAENRAPNPGIDFQAIHHLALISLHTTVLLI
jgi:hypothetical protein